MTIFLINFMQFRINVVTTFNISRGSICQASQMTDFVAKFGSTKIVNKPAHNHRDKLAIISKVHVCDPVGKYDHNVL